VNPTHPLEEGWWGCHKGAMFLPFIFALFTALSFGQDQYLTLDQKQIVVPKLGSKQLLTSHPRFSSFIQAMFNKPGSFHGPNCYNTSLIATGAFAQTNLRYVSPEEFEAILKASFVKVSEAAYKDILVFDAKSSRGHAAFYLGDGLIFHKKSYGTQYFYRITDFEKAGVVEENEWVPGPTQDSSLQMKWPELGKLPMEGYRRRSVLPRLDPRLSSLLTKMELAVVADAKSWGIGKKWGMTGEYFLQDLQNYARTIKTDKYTEGMIISLKDQVYIMLEEVHFRSSRSSSSVLEEICVPEQPEQLFGFIKELGLILKKDAASIQKVINGIKEQVKSRCSVRPVSELIKI
jgi:hypothetical protein